MKKILTVGLVALAPKLLEDAYDYGCSLLFGENETEYEITPATRRKADRTELSPALLEEIQDDIKLYKHYSQVDHGITLRSYAALVVYLNEKHNLNKSYAQYKRIETL